MSHVPALLAEVSPWLAAHGYLILFLAIMVEGMGIPTPGQTLLIGASLLAGKGVLNPVMVLACGLSAALLGANAGFLMGRRGGRRLILHLGVNRHRLAKLTGFYHRFGAWPALFDRFFDGARQLGSMLAGTAAMSWPRFFLFDGLGALCWVALWGLGPLELERHAAQLHVLWGRVNPVVAGLVVATLAGLAVWLWRRHDAAIPREVVAASSGGSGLARDNRGTIAGKPRCR